MQPSHSICSVKELPVTENLPEDVQKILDDEAKTKWKGKNEGKSIKKRKHRK